MSNEIPTDKLQKRVHVRVVLTHVPVHVLNPNLSINISITDD